MTLLPADQAALRGALADVRKAAQRAEQQPDTEAVRQALQAVRMDVIRALTTLDIAEMNAREAARQRLEMA